MATYTEVKQKIQQWITSNANREVTAQIMRDMLNFLSDWIQLDNFVFIYKCLTGFTFAELSQITDFQLSIVQNFKCKDEGRIRHWSYIQGDTSSPNGGTIVNTSTGKVLKGLIENNVIFVDYFGAKGDGTTINTTAIQSAINIATGLTGNGLNYSVRIGNGTYLTDKIILPSGTVTLEGTSFYSQLKLIPNSTSDCMIYVPNNCVPYFRNLFLEGNKANQTSSVSGIIYQSATGYIRCGKIENVHIWRFKGDGIFVGEYRQLLHAINLETNSNDGYGLYQSTNSADFFVSHSEFGSNLLGGAYFYSQAECNNCAFYANGDFGVKFGARVRYSTVINSMIDNNKKHGIEIEGTLGEPCGVSIMSNRLNDNSQLTDNTYSHIYVKNANGVMIVGNNILKSPSFGSSIQPKYLVEIVNSTNTTFQGNRYDPASFKTAFSNDDTLLGNVSQNNYLGTTIANGDFFPRKNISFTQTLANMGTSIGNILGLNKLIFGSGDPTQVLGAGRIGGSAGNDQLQIDYGSAGLVVRNNGLAVTWFCDTSNRTFFNTTTTYPSAQVAIDSTNRGFLTPRLTTTQRNAISSPATGLEIFNITLNKKQFYNGTAWETITSA